MSDRHAHATPAELELYVLGGLDPERAAAVEEHCASCEACARGLAGEARLEVAFEQVARNAERPPVVVARPVRAAAYGAAGLVAMAAAVLLWFGRAAATPASGEGTAAAAHHHSMQDGAILDAKNDALDGG
ncbi:MAG TPA: zf-HC2 domain-containing protein [Polyangiaceae bacterium]